MNDNLTNKRAYIHQARKGMTQASDLDKKYRIVNLLHKHFKINALGMVDQYIYARNKESNQIIITTFSEDSNLFMTHEVNSIDLFIKADVVQRIIEIDGLEHGFFDKITESKQTTDRNTNYKLGGYTEENKRLVVLTTEDMKKDDAALVETLESKLGLRALSPAVGG